MRLFILAAMLFMHIVDDWYLQGLLARCKQKIWWENNHPEELYKNDYLAALIIHAFSWTFMIQLPAAWYYIHNWFNINAGFFILMILNTAIHAYIDNLKANERKINLVIDQLIHIGQVIATWIILILILF